MRKVSDILGRKGASAVAVAPDTKVIEALNIMAEKNIGSVLVMDGGEYLGIITKEIIQGKLPLSTKVLLTQRFRRSCQQICHL
jgi:CBS domain-containing protein